MKLSKLSKLFKLSWTLPPFVLIGLSAVFNAGATESFDHLAWDSLLKKHVIATNDGRASKVDYNGMVVERLLLKQYLTGLEGVSQTTFDAWPEREQLAFLINAYNAWTVELILTKYPHLESIKDLGSLFRSPWKKRFIPLLGKTRSLDDIEHGLIRGSGRYQDPRIHFAVNCASIGCPALRAEAYAGDELDVQLDVATRLFLEDRTRNRFEEGVLKVSSIFKWYRRDFEQGWRDRHSLVQFLAAYDDAFGLSDQQVQSLIQGHMDIEFLEYDWRLNHLL